MSQFRFEGEEVSQNKHICHNCQPSSGSNGHTNAVQLDHWGPKSSSKARKIIQSIAISGVWEMGCVMYPSIFEAAGNWGLSSLLAPGVRLVWAEQAGIIFGICAFYNGEYQQWMVCKQNCILSLLAICNQFQPKVTEVSFTGMVGGFICRTTGRLSVVYNSCVPSLFSAQ